MKISNVIIVLLCVFTLFSCKNEKSNNNVTNSKEDLLYGDISKELIQATKVIPITHGTLVLETKHDIIYIDPTGGLEAFKNQKPPSLVLITDIHGDHLNVETLEALDLENVTLIAPAAVVERLPENICKTVITLKNDDFYNFKSIKIEAIPMYNLREDALKYHPKGRGNGYVLNIEKERIYISGDTEDIPEMRELKAIDKAFVCMNLPYTMTIESAASAVLEFKPKQIYPYHYRGTKGLSDVENFKNIVNKSTDEINVILLDWY